ncbi:MAG TPA: C4-type zinc ribbon domain-containing protein [Syntrophorhabdaceae bacterium]|nr:C4-type zinc ribbon domain-containing protein [Syntrophorhabdaceae bacterium]HPP07188.1 C4-type zinc ribbon domain-containing protein [Syntrophorhabdaceae bacterium]
MEHELKTIYEVQLLETNIINNEKKKLIGPKKIEEMDRELEELQKKAEKEKAVIDELDKERRKKEKELDVEKDRIKKIEAKLYEVKTNKEYQALLKEIEMAKEEIDKTEEDIIILMDRTEELKKDYAGVLEQMKKREKEIKAEKDNLLNELANIDKTLEELKKQREQLLKNVREDIKNLYLNLIEKREGLAVVNVKNGVCLGCYMNIPPQLFIEVTKNSRLITCPSCNRIFYFVEDV